MKAHCNCGAVGVAISDDLTASQLRHHICHCSNCRKTAGSAFAPNLVVPSDKVTLTGAENLRLYEDPNSLSGKVVRRFFCGTCGNPIKTEAESLTEKGLVVLKLGIFDKIPPPQAEAFVKYRQEWVAPIEGTVQYVTSFGGEKQK